MSPRIEPLPRDNWDDAVEAAIRGGVKPVDGDRFFSEGPDALRVPNAIATAMHHPGIAGPYLAYNGVLLREGLLEQRHRELMVLLVAWRTRSWYEWVQHVRLAPRWAITPEEIQAIADGTGDWTPLETDLLAATDQLLQTYRIEDATWARLANELDEARMIELVYVVGTYTLLAMSFNSLQIELDPELAEIDAPPFPPHEGDPT